MDLVLLQDALKETQGQVSTPKGSRRAQSRDEVTGVTFGDRTLSKGDSGLSSPHTRGLSQTLFGQHPGVVSGAEAF